MPKVRVKGTNDVINFPDGLSEEQIKQVLSQRYSTPATQAISDRLSIQPTASPVERTFSEMLSDKVGDTLYDTGVISDRYRARDTGRTLGTMAEFAPPVASAMAGDTFGREVKQGDYLGASLSALEGSLEANPVAGALASAVPVVAKKGRGLLDKIGGDDLVQESDKLYKFSNVNPEYVETIGELGGLPSPSIGIAKASSPVDSFGEISLIGRVGSFEGDPTFAADVYSPRQPRAEIEVPYNNIVAEQARLKADNPDIYQNYGAPRLDTSSDPVDAARTEPAYIAEFARSKGIDVSPEAQAKESKDLLDLESYFGTELDNDTGITDSLSRQAKKYFSSSLPPKPPEGASPIKKKKYQDKLEFNRMMFTNGDLNDLGYDVLKNAYESEKAKSMFDARKASRNIKDQFIEKGLDSEYEEFIANKVKSLNPEKSLFDRDYFYDTGERRSLDYNLENITKMMTKGDIRGGEGFAGTGGARALVAPELKSLKDIKDSRGRIITSGEFSDVSSEVGNLTVELQTNLIKEIPEVESLIYDHTGFYDEIKSYIDGTESIFDGLGDKNKKLLNLYLKVLEEMPTEYFEIKPQRAVELSEFYGAAVPKGTSRKVTAPLENAGIKIEYYDPEKGRQSAIKSLHEQSNGDILFSAGGIGLVTAATVGDNGEDDNEL